jgi:hypothetical protein
MDTSLTHFKVNNREEVFRELSPIFKTEDIPEVYGGTRKHIPVPNASGVDNYFSSLDTAAPEDLDISDVTHQGRLKLT